MGFEIGNNVKVERKRFFKGLEVFTGEIINYMEDEDIQGIITKQEYTIKLDNGKVIKTDISLPSKYKIIL